MSASKERSVVTLIRECAHWIIMMIHSGVVIASLSTLLFFVLIICQVQNYRSFGQDGFLDDSNDIGISSNISGVTCDQTEHLVYHNHTKLVINIQNQSLTIPADIGIVPNECIFWLHTHDDSGIIHVESPTKVSFSLGQFLQVWDSFDNSSLINDILQNNLQVNASILLENGTAVKEHSFSVPNIPLEDLAIITLDLNNVTDT